MIGRLICFIGLILIVNFGFCQNLLPNPSFEDTAVKVTPLYLPAFWSNAVDQAWDYYTPLHDTIDNLWSAPQNLIGFQTARTGRAYLGLLVYQLFDTVISNQREYLQVELLEPLVQDSIYCIQFYASLADSSTHASRGQMGIYLSQNKVSGNNGEILPYNPQVIISPDSHIVSKTEWTEIEHSYKAVGGERYFTLGNFNDSTFLDSLPVSGGGNKFWMTTAYYYYDDFYFGPCDSVPLDTAIGILEYGIKAQEAKVFPNPTDGLINIEVENIDTYDLEVFDKAGRSVLTASFNGSKTQLDLTGMSRGIYFIRIISDRRAYYQKVILQY